MDGKQYCQKCSKHTQTIYNSFMVAFCSKCHTMRFKVSDYTGHKQPFECVGCGCFKDEDFVGQRFCSDCEGEA